MNSLPRLIFLVLAVMVVSACQPRIQPIYVPSEIAIPASLNETPLPVIGEGIIAAGKSKKWKMQELEPGVVRGTLDVRGKHQAVVDVVFNNRQYAINYVSSRELLSQGARIHRSYNAWVRELENSIGSSLNYMATKVQMGQPATPPPAPAKAAAAATAAATPTADGEFNPAGIWNVSATYSPTALSQALCSKQRSWDFQLDYSKRGGISETYWSDGVQLNVTGEHSSDVSELSFAVPSGGNNWNFTERLKLDKPQVRLTAEPETSTATNCIGVIDIVMKKQGGGSHTASSPTATTSKNSFSAKGQWTVSASYVSTSSNSSWCSKAADWNFTLQLKNGEISETYYTNSKALYVTGEMDDDYLDLKFDVPSGGRNWKWTERFDLDRPDKRLSLIAEDGSCTGSIDIHMKKQG
ncbi:hypothetical protein NBZ79_06705 [Sneathiella marina]|uniref:Lipoprotein n=1 Tax=Sneathiella marina TaxID=2950108 RepID=A0ABY4WDG4_9PROT|nr:hypothetical protein [Sneathiella marina]USG62666.1 hypothetical protein NBZ79_06705 [Sneathiella marina]